MCYWKKKKCLKGYENSICHTAAYAQQAMRTQTDIARLFFSPDSA